VEITKDKDAKMHWTNYFHNVIQCYQVIIKGWPTNIPFTNLSQVSSALPNLDMLLRKWQSNAIKWRQVDNEEFQQLLKEHNEKLENGKLVKHHWRTHSDKGKKRAQSLGAHGESTHQKKTYKSVETINTDDKMTKMMTPEKAPQLPTSTLMMPAPT
jgi:hypothetical protein